MKRLSIIAETADNNLSSPEWTAHKNIRELTSANPLSLPRFEPWGIEEFDQRYSGLVANAFNMLAVPTYDAAIAAVGHFIEFGLNQGQPAALVTLENSQLVLSKLSFYGFDFTDALQTERLIYLYYTPTFSHALSSSTQYQALFDEIEKLSGSINRLAFLNADLLFNLQTEYLARVSANKLNAAASSLSLTILGCFVHHHTQSHTLLDAVCSDMIPSYLGIKPKSNSDSQNFTIQWHKGPYAGDCETDSLQLEIGQGYVLRNYSSSQLA